MELAILQLSFVPRHLGFAHLNQPLGKYFHTKLHVYEDRKVGSVVYTPVKEPDQADEGITKELCRLDIL